MMKQLILFYGISQFALSGEQASVANGSKPEFEPIGKDEKIKEKLYFCVGCGSVATQTALFKIEGATIIERYCNKVVSYFLMQNMFHFSTDVTFFLYDFLQCTTSLR